MNKIRKMLKTCGITFTCNADYLKISLLGYTLEISLGNAKLPWPIINFSCATQCTGEAKGFCQVCRKCYAKNYELTTQANGRSNVLEYRFRQFCFFRTTPERIVRRLFEVACILLRSLDIRYLRLQEAGDFPGQWAVRIASDMANIAHKYGISVYTYTTRSDLDYSNRGHLVVLGSSWDGPDGKTIVIPKGTKAPKGFTKCPKKCGKCKLCPKGYNVAFEEHGSVNDMTTSIKRAA